MAIGSGLAIGGSGSNGVDVRAGAGGGGATGGGITADDGIVNSCAGAASCDARKSSTCVLVLTGAGAKDAAGAKDGGGA